MKRILSTVLLTLSLNCYLQADYDVVDYTNTELPSGKSGQVPNLLKGGSGMFAIETNSDFISHSKFDKKTHKHQSISFCGFDIDGSMIIYYDKENNEAASVEIGYNRTNIHWKENNYFSQNIFNTATLSVNAQTSRMCNWLWRGKLSLNVDTNHFDLEEYSTWDCFIWGRNTYTDNVGLHMGIIVLTGMKIDHVYPIIGFDWVLTEKWKINAVFPVNMSVVYVIDDNWALNLKGRAFETRNRVGKNENLSRGLIQYFNTGLEFGVDYDVGDSIQANVHVGETFGGKIKIANRNNHNSRRFRFKTAPYIGAEVMVRY